MNIRGVVAAVGVALLLVGCGGGGAGGGSAASHGGHGADEQVHEPVAGAPEVTLTAVDLDFQPAAVELQAGQPVNLTIVNDGEALHDFTLDAADVHVNVEPGTAKTTSITIDQHGTYEAICTVEGHAQAGMTVDVVVT